VLTWLSLGTVFGVLCIVYEFFFLVVIFKFLGVSILEQRKVAMRVAINRAMVLGCGIHIVQRWRVFRTRGDSLLLLSLPNRFQNYVIFSLAELYDISFFICVCMCVCICIFLHLLK
jgi:hypothetical protein